MSKIHAYLGMILIVMVMGCEDRQPSVQPEARTTPANPQPQSKVAPQPVAKVAPAKVAQVKPKPEKAKPKQPLAIVPFRVLGKGLQPDAGTMLAEAMLPLFDKTHRLVDQTQLRKFMDQADLTLAGLSEKTASGKDGVKLKGVRYLVVGTLSRLPDGTLAVTARMTDWTTGEVVQGRVGRLTAPDWSSLQELLGLLVGQLTGQETMDLFDEGMVQVQDQSLVVRVMARGKTDLDRVQAARRLSRQAYARYAQKHGSPAGSKSVLLGNARDTEKMIDAELHGSVLLYTVSFDLPKGVKK